MLRILTSGESHGPGLMGIIDGLPSGLKIDIPAIDFDLSRRQMGYGRGERMKIEKDTLKILGGLMKGKTIGAPLAFWIENKDWANWQGKSAPPKTVPRPGHVDLAGLLKYGLDDIQSVIERASARETAIKVAIGSALKQFLSNFGIELAGHVIEIGEVAVGKEIAEGLDIKLLRKKAFASPVFCLDQVTSRKMCQRIDLARNKKDTVGGVFEVIAQGVPIGLGTYAQWDRRLDADLARALMSIPSVKAVEIGNGVENAALLGSKVHDVINYTSQKGYFRKSNRAGGIEGGVSNGQRIVVRGYAKPISTLLAPLNSVDTASKKKTKAPYVRSDICFVPALSVVGEAAVALVFAQHFLDKFGGDALAETKRNYSAYLRTLK